MSNSTRGTHLERVVQDMLQDAGYFVVRSAGSHGVADLVALGQLGTLPFAVLVQCKVFLKLLGSREHTELYETCRSIGAIPVVAHRPTPRTVAFHELLGPRGLHSRASGLLRTWVP